MVGNARTPIDIKEEAAMLFKITYENEHKTMDECTVIVNEMLGTNISRCTLRRWAYSGVDLSCDKTGKKRDYYKTKYSTDFKKKVIMRYDELMSTGKSQCATVAQINKEFDSAFTATNIIYWKKTYKSKEEDKLIGKRIYYDETLEMMRIADD